MMSSNLQYSMCLMEFCKRLEKYELERNPSPTNDQFSYTASIYSGPISMKSLAYPYTCELEHFSKLAADKVRHLSSKKQEKEQECDSLKSVMQNFRTSSTCDVNEHACSLSLNYPTVNKLQTMCNLASSVEETNPAPVDATQLSLKNILLSMGKESTIQSASQNFFYSSLLLQACQCWEADRNCNSKSSKMKRSHPTCVNAGHEHNYSCKQMTKCTKHARIEAFVSCHELDFPHSSSISSSCRQNNELTEVSSACVKSSSDEDTFLFKDGHTLKMDELSNVQNHRISQKLYHATKSPDITSDAKTEKLLKMYLCSKRNMCNDSDKDNGKEQVLSIGNSVLQNGAKLELAESEEQNNIFDETTIETSTSKLSRIPELIPFTLERLKNFSESWTTRCDDRSAVVDQDDANQSADGLLNVVPTLSMAGLLCRLNIGPEHSEVSQLEGSKDYASSQLTARPQCYLCDIQFISSLDLQQHILLHHTTRGAHGKVRD